MLAFILRLFRRGATPPVPAALPPAPEPEPVAEPPRPIATVIGVDTRIMGPVTSCSDMQIAG